MTKEEANKEAIKKTTKFYKSDKRTETVIGDEKQPKWHPRIKIKKWDNEANLSVGLKHIWLDSKFYPIKKKPQKKHKTLVWQHLGAIEPIEVPIEYELSHHLPSNDIVVRTYWSKEPALMLFERYPHTKYIGDDVDIPLVRAASLKGNPYYMDDGLVMIDIHYNHNEQNLEPLLSQAVQEVLLKEYGVKTYHKKKSDPKLYYKDKKDHDVKIYSPETRAGHTWTYINIDTDYLKAYEYYADKKVAKKDIRDKYAYGLKKSYPGVNNKIIEKVMQRFAQLTKLNPRVDTYSKKELKKIDELRLVHESDDWVFDGNRDDLDWWYEEGEAGFEFEVILDKKPDSNKLPLTIQEKQIVAYVQKDLTPKERSEGYYRKPTVTNSLAIYHATYDPLCGDKFHQVGKLFHIYRPIIIDAEGKKVWGDFEHIDKYKDGDIYDLSKGLNVVVPQDFLDNAAYPVIVDPTFGYTGSGAGNTANVDDAVLGTIQTATSTGNITSIHLAMNLLGAATWEYEGAIYRNSDSGLIAQSANSTAGTTGVFTALAMSGSITAGTSYNLCGWGQGTGGGYNAVALLYDSTAGKTSVSHALAYSANNWPDPGSFTTTANRQFSVFVTFESTADFLIMF